MPSETVFFKSRFIKIGNRIINLNNIAYLELFEDKVTIVLMHPSGEKIQSNSQEAKELKEHFKNLIDYLPSQRERLVKGID